MVNSINKVILVVIIINQILFTNEVHTNNWAILVETSRSWFNYRHVANVLSIYHTVKRLGIPDSHIILMVADDIACNPRNPKPGMVFNHKDQTINVFGDNVEIDYRGNDVTVENFIRILTGRHLPGTPESRKLMSDEKSNILIYMTGHGGDGFLKFQDSEEITNVEIGNALSQMWEKGRYKEIFFVIDTCQATSMFQKFNSPNLLGFASSLVGEDSLSHHIDSSIGVYVIDRFTYYILQFLEKVRPNSQKSLYELFKACPKWKCGSTVGNRTDLYPHDLKQVPITNFFGSKRQIVYLPHVDGYIDFVGAYDTKNFDNFMVIKGILMLCLLYYVFLFVYTTSTDEASSNHKIKYQNFERETADNNLSSSPTKVEDLSAKDPIKNGSLGVEAGLINSTIAGPDKSLDYKANKDYYEALESDRIPSEANIGNGVEPNRDSDNFQTSHQVIKKVLESAINLLEGFELSKLPKLAQNFRLQTMSVFQPDTPIDEQPFKLAGKRRKRRDLENIDLTSNEEEEDAELDRQYNRLLREEADSVKALSKRHRSMLDFSSSDQPRYRKAGNLNPSFRNERLTSFNRLPKPAAKLENHDDKGTKRNPTMAKNFPAPIDNYYGPPPILKSPGNPYLRRPNQKTQMSHGGVKLNSLDLVTFTSPQASSRSTTTPTATTSSTNAPSFESTKYKSTPNTLQYPTIIEKAITKTTMFTVDTRHEHQSPNNKVISNNPIAPVRASPRPRILFWNPIFSMWQAKRSMKLCQPYLAAEADRHSNSNGLSTIPSLPMCEITSDRSLFRTSDVVVFHPFQLSLFDLPNSTLLSNTIRMKQKWVFVSQESPSNLKERTNTNALAKTFPYPTITGWETMFDWLVTYNTKPVSDFFYPYGKRFKLPHDPHRHIGLDIEKLRSRKLIAAVVSNCQCKKRLEFIHKLQKLLPEMELFGKCFKREVCLESQRSTVYTPTSMAKSLTTHQLGDYAQKYFNSMDTFYRSNLKLYHPNDPHQMGSKGQHPHFRVPVLPDQYYKELQCNTRKLDHGTLNSADARHAYVNKYVRVETVTRKLVSKNHSCLMDVISQYKFVLAIENSANCPDYITEKYWVWPLKTGTIPIVGGSDRETYERLAIPGSYLHIDDYSSVEELANHIKHIDGNIRAHARLLEWRKTWGVGDSIPNTWCELCQQAQREMNQGAGPNNNSGPGQLRDKEHRQLAQSKSDNKIKFNRWWNGCSSYYR